MDGLIFAIDAGSINSLNGIHFLNTSFPICLTEKGIKIVVNVSANEQ